jgi:hypothetical protein
MSNLYHRFAVASIGIALGFALGANKEAKAATFTLTGTQFFIEDIFNQNGFGTDGLGDRLLNSRYDKEFLAYQGGYIFDIYDYFPTALRTEIRERRAFYEFNLGNLSLTPNTVIRSAIFQQQIEEAHRSVGSNRFRSLDLEIFGYAGNGKPDLSDFGAGVSLGIRDAVSLSEPPRCYPYPYSYCNTQYNGGFLILDVTKFLNERVSNRDAFAGFGVRVYDSPFLNEIGFPNRGGATLSDSPYLIIETEPVPEPTTIFGSALALGVGGWLKRKKSNQQNKTTSQH